MHCIMQSKSMINVKAKAKTFLLAIKMCMLSLIITSPAIVMAQTAAYPPVENNYPLVLQHTTYDTPTIKRMIIEGQRLRKTSFDSTAAILEKGFEASLHARYQNGIIVALDQLAGIYAERGMYEVIQKRYQEAMILCIQDKSLSRALLTIYNGMATLYQYKGDYAAASKYYYLAIFVQDQVAPNISTGMIYNNFAAMLIHMQQYKQAMYYLDRAELLAKEKNMAIVQSLVLVNKGVIHTKEKRWEEALLYLNMGLALAKEKGLIATQHLALTNIGITYME